MVPVYESQVTPTAVSEAGGRPAVPPRPEVAASPSRWTGGRIAALVIGVVLVLLALPLLGGGGTALWADLTQRDGGYATTDVHEFSTGGSALATVSTDLGSAGVGWLYSPTCSARFGSGSRRRAPARRCSSGSAPLPTSIATSRA